MWTDNVTCVIRYGIHTLINRFLNFKLYYVFVILPTFIFNLFFTYIHIKYI